MRNGVGADISPWKMSGHKGAGILVEIKFLEGWFDGNFGERVAGNALRSEHELERRRTDELAVHHWVRHGQGYKKRVGIATLMNITKW